MSGASHKVQGKAPIKVAVIGGGCAAMAAAFELSRPEHAGAYEVTVYQQGFRLGGKGASGRGPCDRIEEHGLHLWMGFYENAFGLMRECYAELGRDPATCRIASIEDAFVASPVSSVADFAQDGRCVPWRVLFPPQPGLPGEPAEAQEPWTIARYLGRCLSLLGTLLESLEGADAAVSGEQTDPAERIRRLLGYGGLLTLGAVREGLSVLEAVLRVLPGVSEELVARLGRELTAAVQARIEALAERDDALRRLWEIVDLVLAVVRGAIRSRLLTDPRGFDAIDDYDCREWLSMNGASRRAINSAFVRALYDLAFAYEDGDVTRPRIAAGQALRGAVRAFFTYRGSFFWKMTSGMGDIMFAPLYQLLERRGVRFEFFHKLTNIALGEVRAGEPSHVAALELDVQAHVRGGGGYQPLCDVRGLPCWPSEPDYDQLQDGPQLQAAGVRFESHWETRCAARKTLTVSRDFDVVVLGVSLGAIPYVARELIAREPRWAAQVEHCKTVGTQAFQLWLRADARELGWPLAPGALSGYVEPFDTWADMSHLIREESFPGEVQSIAYFCSVLPDVPMPQIAAAFTYPDARRREVCDNAVRFLNGDVAGIWPHAQRAPGEFRWDLLVPPTAADAASGSERFRAQFWTANVNPSDRYALSLPGSLRHRLSPLDACVDNLSVVGDWTDCGFNEGCVEAAVMSGRLAAHAISQKPALTDIIGYDHP